MRNFSAIALWSCMALTGLHTAVADTDKGNVAAATVRMETTLGNIDIALDQEKAPKTVENFLRYVDEGFYSNTLFHRVIPGFMIQGGGFTAGMKKKNTHDPIANEANNGLKNVNGAIAMARTGDPHSATAQFFINTADNIALNHRAKNAMGWGYAVFGKVTNGMDVVRKIENVTTRNSGRYQNVPARDIVITKVYRLKTDKKK